MSSPRLTFDGGARTLAGYGIAFAVIAAVFVPLDEVASAVSTRAWYLQEVVLFLVVTGVTLGFLRYESVGVDDIGLGRRHLLPGVVAFGGIYLGLNAVGVGLATALGNPWGLDLVTATVPPSFTALPAAWVLFVLLQCFIGFVEEFAFRGYFQNKVVAFLGGDTRARVAAGVLAASVLFGLLHAPGAAVGGASLAGVVGVVLMRALTGVFFGTFYELTRNVYFVALLHGFGNTWPLLVDWSTWSTTGIVAFFAGVTVLYFGATLAYRRWAADTVLTPSVSRVDFGARRLLA